MPLPQTGFCCALFEAYLMMFRMICRGDCLLSQSFKASQTKVGNVINSGTTPNCLVGKISSSLSPNTTFGLGDVNYELVKRLKSQCSHLNLNWYTLVFLFMYGCFNHVTLLL